MKTDSEIRAEGMAALVAALGPVEAERFIASLSRERFDYTEWRRRHLPQMSVPDLSEQASKPSDQSRVDSGARARMIEGVNILATAVKVTLGPKGR